MAQMSEKPAKNATKLFEAGAPVASVHSVLALADRMIEGALDDVQERQASRSPECARYASRGTGSRKYLDQQVPPGGLDQQHDDAGLDRGHPRCDLQLPARGDRGTPLGDSGNRATDSKNLDREPAAPGGRWPSTSSSVFRTEVACGSTRRTGPARRTQPARLGPGRRGGAGRTRWVARVGETAIGEGDANGRVEWNLSDGAPLSCRQHSLGCCICIPLMRRRAAVQHSGSMRMGISHCARVSCCDCCHQRCVRNTDTSQVSADGLT